MEHLSDITRSHRNASAFALDMESRQTHGERILDHDAFLCGCGCGKIINLDTWDVDGAEWLQPTGFYCDSCMQWFTNDCGDRKNLRCDGCLAYAAAQELVSLATSIRDNLWTNSEKPKAALESLRAMIGVEAPLGRRLRRMIAKSQPIPAMESCDPSTCAECRQEIA